MDNQRVCISLTVLTIIFVVLKLCGVIDWSWWWVFSPVWISLLFWALFLFAIGCVFLVSLLVLWLADKLPKTGEG